MIDYVTVFAEKLKKDNRLFEQQKSFIEAQFQGSSSFFKNMFKGKDFKTCARKYLRERGLLSKRNAEAGI